MLYRLYVPGMFQIQQVSEILNVFQWSHCTKTVNKWKLIKSTNKERTQYRWKNQMETGIKELKLEEWKKPIINQNIQNALKLNLDYITTKYDFRKVQ